MAKNLFFVEVIDGWGNCGQSLGHLLNIIIVKVYVELKTSFTSGTESGKAGEVSYGWAVYPASQVLQMECVGNHFRPHMMCTVYYITLDMSISVETRKKIALCILIVILPIWKH